MSTISNRTCVLAFASIVFLVVGCSPSTDATATSNVEQYKGSASISQGLAKTIEDNLFECENGRSRVAGVGEITSTDGKVWVVPAKNHFSTADKATDLYEECAKITPQRITDVDQSSVPIAVIDNDGQEVTGYIFADNYFELYINGQLIAVDSVPFTPFNSSIVKFKVNKPYTIAVKVIDWEENLGLGTEDNRGKAYHPGDGGFIASFSDGTVTNSNWQAQTYYTSPIYDLTCLSEIEGKRLSESCTTDGTDDGANAFAAHWEVPEDWMSQDFDSSLWPEATEYSDDEIGVNNKNSYMNFIDKFSDAGARFIWSTNVVLDNEVLLRYVVK